MGNGRILVVEDNRDNMTLIADMLDALNYEVLYAHDGWHGVDTAVEQQPDLILMDLSLPIMDGWTATRTLKANTSAKHIPIIALTAHAMSGDRERAISAGCDEYVAKPIDLVELNTKILKLLAARKSS